MIFQTKLVGFSTFNSKKSGDSYIKYCVADIPPKGFVGVNYLTGICSLQQIPDPVLGDIVVVSTDRFGRIVDIQKQIIAKGDKDS